MTTMVVKPPYRALPPFQGLSKKDSRLRKIRDFKSSNVHFVPPKSHINRYQGLSAKIHPNKFLERDIEERNPCYVEGSETEYGDDDANLCADVLLEAYEYVDDICAFYKSKEMSMCTKPSLIARLKLDFHRKLRADIVEWVIAVHDEFKFPTEALYLAINLLDRFLAVHPVEKKTLSLVGVTALQLAVKYAGLRESTPCFHLFSDLTLTTCPLKHISCSVEQICEMEDLMLNTIQYDLSVSTPSVFMWKFLKETQSNDTIKHLSFFFIDLFLVQHETFTFRPSLLAAAAIYTAHATLKRCKPCSKIYEQLTDCSPRQILKCSRLMVSSHREAGSVECVFRKYDTRRNDRVARAKPAHFLLSKSRRARILLVKIMLFLEGA